MTYDPGQPGAWHLGSASRLPPVNIDAERALLGAMLANPKVIDRLPDHLAAEHFAYPEHACVFAAIRRRHDGGGVADVVSLRAELEHAPALTAVGGGAYLATLLTCTVGITNAGEYARVVFDCWQRRELIEACEVACNAAFGTDGDTPVTEAMERLDGELLSIAGGVNGSEPVSAARAAEKAMEAMLSARDRKGALAGLSYGYAGLDRMTGGLRPKQLVTIGARPSMGKTALALGIAIGAARSLQAVHGEGGPPRVLFISAEMGAGDIMARAIAAEAGLPLDTMTRAARREEDGQLHQLTDREVAQLADASVRLGRLPLTFEEGVNTVAGIRAVARRMKRRGALDLVVIDYLGLLRASLNAQRQNKVQEITELTWGLKTMARDLDVPVVLLSQLSREVERREDKTPMLSDLRDSGSIEQDSDIVMFLYRAHYYLMRNPPPPRGEKEAGEKYEARLLAHAQAVRESEGRGTIIIAKQRQGRIGPVRMRFSDHLAWFYDDSERPPGGGD